MQFAPAPTDRRFMDAASPSSGDDEPQGRRPTKERPGGAPFINNLPQEVIDRFEASQIDKSDRYPTRWIATLRATVRRDRPRPRIRPGSNLPEVLDREPPSNTDPR